MDLEQSKVMKSTRNGGATLESSILPEITTSKLKIFDVKKEKITMSKRLKASGIKQVSINDRNKDIGLTHEISTKLGDFDSRYI